LRRLRQERAESAQGTIRYAAKIVVAIAAQGAHAAFGRRWPPAFRERQARMIFRSRRETVTFKHPFRIRGLDRLLPAGAYEVVTDEETIEGLSFQSFRRVATLIKVPVEGRRGLAMEVISIGSVDLADAQRIDASASDG
jgi:hypothetical protein